jgi:hypothetical protein
VTRRYGSKHPTKRNQAAALAALIDYRRVVGTLDTIDVAGVARSHGVKPAEVAAMVEAAIRHA